MVDVLTGTPGMTGRNAAGDFCAMKSEALERKEELEKTK
jgi:hypothetical protein